MQTLNVISLLGRCVWDGAWYMFPLENQGRVKYNTSCILASLWINVHSVKKINWINTINSPQRCRISLVFSPHHLQMYSLCFQKINICLCTVLREVGIWNGRVFCVNYVQSWWLWFFWDDQQQWFDMDSNNMFLWRWNRNQMQSERGACFSQNRVLQMSKR